MKTNEKDNREKLSISVRLFHAIFCHAIALEEEVSRATITAEITIAVSSLARWNSDFTNSKN